MRAAVRYYSRSGNTKAVAEALAKAAGVQALSVDAPGAALAEKADVLFIGGALYAYGLDSHLKEYLASLDKARVGRAVVFSTSWLSKHAVDLMRSALAARGIPVESEFFYCKSNQARSQEAACAAFAKKFL